MDESFVASNASAVDGLWHCQCGYDFTSYQGQVKMGLVGRSHGVAKTFRLDVPELASQLDDRFAQCTSPRGFERLTAVRLGLGGQHTLAQLGEAVGRSRSWIIEWMRVVRQEGLGSLLSRHQGRGA